MIQVDQIVVRVSEEGEPAIRARPARGRIGGRDELGHDLGRAAERRFVEHGQILADSMARVVGWLPPIAGRRVLAVGVRLDHRRVDREALAADEPFRDAAGDRRLEQLAEQIALAKATMPVLREGRVVGHRAVQTQPAEPAIGEVEVNLFAQAPL